MDRQTLVALFREEFKRAINKTQHGANSDLLRPVVISAVRKRLTDEELPTAFEIAAQDFYSVSVAARSKHRAEAAIRDSSKAVRETLYAHMVKDQQRHTATLAHSEEERLERAWSKEFTYQGRTFPGGRKSLTRADLEWIIQEYEKDRGEIQSRIDKEQACLDALKQHHANRLGDLPLEVRLELA